MVRRFFRQPLEIGRRNVVIDWERLREFGLVPFSIIMLGAAVTAIVSIPAIFGVFTIVLGDDSTPSPIESIGLVLSCSSQRYVVCPC